jgi:1-acyl-sn-glycerol-3-phosphate acyltransferase
MTAERGRAHALQAHRYHPSGGQYLGLLQWLLKWKRNSRFEPAQVLIDEVDRKQLKESRTLLVLSNHLGFWDPFFIEALNREFRPHSAFHPLMLESEWQKRRWLSRLGVLPFSPTSVGSLKGLLRQLESLRSDPTPRTFLLFPQGQFESHRKDPAHGFKEGWLRIAARLPDCDIVPLVMDYSHSASDRVTPWLAIGSPKSLSAWGESPHVSLKKEVSRLFELVHERQEQSRFRQREKP